jgi:hypothetical protein
MVKVCFKWGAFHWESPEIEALSASIDALQRGNVSEYPFGAGRELLQYKVQFSCDINEVFYNIVFYVSMIVTPNIKSLQSVAIELLQRIPPGVRAGFEGVTEKEYLVYGKKPILVVT